MPFLWRYLLRNYLKVLSLSVAGFISVLLVTRFQTIARFAATGASPLHLIKFILYQIPFILPLAIPISCLFAALLLFRKMSHSHELTSMRTAGVGLWSVAYPLLFCSLIVALANFTLISELSTQCRAKSKSLIYQMTAINPLCLLQKETLVKLKNTHLDMKGLQSGNFAEDVTFIMRNVANRRLGLMLAKKISLQGEKIVGDKVTFVSSIDSREPDCHDHLIIENQSLMETKADQISQYLKSSDWNVNYNYLNMRMLLAKNALEKHRKGPLASRALVELSRRVSLALAAITFTLVGIAFGVCLQKGRNIKSILLASLLGILFLTCFIAAKSMKHTWVPSVIFYLLPHPILIIASARALRKRSMGIE